MQVLQGSLGPEKCAADPEHWLPIYTEAVPESLLSPDCNVPKLLNYWR